MRQSSLLLLLVVGGVTISWMEASPILYSSSSQVISSEDTDESDDYTNQNGREKRSFTQVHYYPIKLFWQIVFEDCEQSLYCLTAPQFCSGLPHFFCSDNKVYPTCTLKFTFTIENVNEVAGIDLSLLMAKQVDAAMGDIYVVILVIDGTSLSKVASFDIIHIQCDGWQTFRLQYLDLNNLINGSNELQLQVLVSFDGYNLISCEDASSIFLINTTFVDVVPPLYGSEDDQEEDNATDAYTESGTMATTDVFGLTEDQKIQYIPIITIHREDNRRRRRRREIAGMTASPSAEISDREEKECQYRDKLKQLEPALGIRMKEDTAYDDKMCKKYTKRTLGEDLALKKDVGGSKKQDRDSFNS